MLTYLYLCSGNNKAESELSAKDNEMLVAAINRHWKFINEQITRTFNGEKTIAINIEK